MNKTRLSIVQLILQWVALAALFVPGFYIMQVLYESYAGYRVVDVGPVSYLTITLGGDNSLAFILTALFMVANIVLTILWLAKRTAVNKVLGCIMSIIPLAVISVFTYSLTLSKDMTYQYPAGWLCYVEFVILITSFALSVIIARCKNDEAPKKAAVIVSSVSNADELKKYKDLLDSGVITEEEFESKKKQLLGL